ncbi:hypothetical protein SERLA73DRAFT_160636 [Serpula lacrymans var. lacrymans S7.3]|uniref:Histone acetyltransferase n=1 Tax=Serpula lacrymans var. lacrymans (strain S7.3) TaxID=936435 RepID=F8PYZ2_SERL3|nr:hypothetical protein SERLA73DRAFT_160636 [Serpula lacrymans var. lacrymans S7.3]
MWTKRSYDWKCLECKNCEVCREKGDDERILFCDFCDRGWHMDCLQPPLQESPPGKWHCPYCPPVDQCYPPIFDPQFLSSQPETSNSSNISPQPVYQTKMDVDVDIEGEDEEAEQQEEEEEETEEAEPEEEEDSTPVPQSKRKKKSSARKRANEEVPSSPVVRPIKRMRIRVHSPAPPLVVRLRIPPKGKGKEREDDEERKNIFDDFLSPNERDTSKTTIEAYDKQRFEKSRLSAEEKLAPPPLPPPPAVPEVPETPVAGPSSRPLRSGTVHQLIIPPAPPTPSPVPSTPSAFPSTPGFVPPTPTSTNTLRIRTIRFGQFDIQTWYDAPFPEEYANIPDGRLWICEFCLKYMKSKFASSRHRMKCKARHPPGDEIYRDGAVSIFEVDGRKNKIYCQNLCLLSRMFLDHKSLFYDVEPFLFYVMTEVDDVGARFVGYFSKEKRSPKDYNVSCIMTLPVRQRQGWGGLLIDFSYLLSKKEQRSGSPEKPLSGLGALGYKNYWTLAVMRYLATAPDDPHLEDISKATSMTIEDIHVTLTQQNMIFHREATPQPVRPTPGQSIKFPRGRKNGIARKHLQRNQLQDEEGTKTPFSPPTHYDIRWDREKVKQYLEKWEVKGYLKLKPERLKWTPFVLARTKNVEVLQTPTGEASGSVDGSTKTAVTPAEDIGVGGNATKFPIPATDAQNTEGMITQDTGAVNVTASPAARLFDDEPVIEVETPLPKKHLRNHKPSGVETPRTGFSRNHSNRLKVTNLRSATRRHTPSALASALPVEAEQTAELIENGAMEQGALTPASQKRRRARVPRTKPLKSLTDREMSADVKRTTSPVLTPTSGLPRKRQRVESPECESVAEETPIIVNGHNRDDGDDQGQPSVEHHCPIETLEPPSSAQSQPSIAENNREMELPPTVLTVSDATPAPKGGMNGQVEQTEHVDVKSEDTGTPLTGSTSRHSVPSDDTVFMAEHVNADNVGGKEGAVERERVEMAERDEDGAAEDVEETGRVLRVDEFGCGPEFTSSLVLLEEWRKARGRERLRAVHWFARMDSQTHSDPGMSYSHIPLNDRRDQSLQSSVNVSSLNQALGSHLTPLGPRPPFPTHDTYRLSDSPPNIIDPTGSSQRAPVPGPPHSPIHDFSVPLQPDSQASALKRKQGDVLGHPQLGGKRRRDEDMTDAFDSDGAHGAKHWSDEEKSKLFNWLMGPGEDDHWNALRATKNSCLRECAADVFGGKKTYQALKGCYERNFNLFKQIYAFEAFNLQIGNGPVNSINEGDRLREFERRLQGARKAGCDVGNVHARTIDHWHRSGWYNLFYRRWNGDPATTRPIARPNHTGTSVSGAGDDGEVDDEPPMDFTEPAQPHPISHPQNGTPPQPLRYHPSEYSISDAVPLNIPSRTLSTVSQPSPSLSSADQPIVNIAVPQNTISACVQLLQLQSQYSKLKVEYMRRREEREEKDSTLRREMDRLRQEREAAEWEHTKQTASVKQKAQLATELLANPSVDSSVRQAAGDYLKRLFVTE